MTAWEVKDSLSQLTVWDESQDEEIFNLCRSSLKEIESMLKADADRSDARIISAAAANAYYKLSLKRSFNSADEIITNFKAGDISVTQNSADKTAQLEKAESFYKDMLQSIIPLCEDNGFAFENIKIKVML